MTGNHRLCIELGLKVFSDRFVTQGWWQTVSYRGSRDKENLAVRSILGSWIHPVDADSGRPGDEMLAWLSVCSEVQMICIQSS